MAEHLIVGTGDKADKYATLLPQVQAMIQYESDIIANMANVASAIYSTFGFLWVGFYRVQGRELVLGPYQGPLACTRIAYGRGVCGTAWKEGHTLNVPDVEAFPGHIACSSDSRSEIVVPVKSTEGEVVAIIDIDSCELATFDHVDEQCLDEIAALMGELY